MQALVTAPDATAIVAKVPIPSPEAGQIRVRVKAIALNPVDALYVVKPASAPGRVIGSDFAGIVESTGEGVTAFNAGDRVAGFLHGACQQNVLPGAFAEYLVVDDDLVYKVPANIPFEEAATLPLCVNTASNGLFRVLGLAAPWHASSGTTAARTVRPAILIYSGATSVGTYAIQLARLSHDSPLIVTTASPSNASYLKSLGADYVLDYHDADWAKQARDIAEAQGVEFKWALDGISEGDTVEQVSHVFGGKGKIATVRGPTQWTHDGIKKGVDAEYMAVWTLLGKEFWYNGGIHFPAQPSHRALAVDMYKYLSASNPSSPLLLGTLQPNKVRLMSGGLDHVTDAFPLFRVGAVMKRSSLEETRPLSAEKMVYRLESH